MHCLHAKENRKNQQEQTKKKKKRPEHLPHKQDNYCATFPRITTSHRQTSQIRDRQIWGEHKAHRPLGKAGEKFPIITHNLHIIDEENKVTSQFKNSSMSTKLLHWKCKYHTSSVNRNSTPVNDRGAKSSDLIDSIFREGCVYNVPVGAREGGALWTTSDEYDDEPEELDNPNPACWRKMFRSSCFMSRPTGDIQRI